MSTDEPPSDRRFSDRRKQERRSTPGRRTSDSSDDLHALTIRQLGRYRLLRELGSGAMAHVYLAEDPTMRRQVAIKTLALADEFADRDLDKAREQFMREARAVARLNHPNIVAIYDVGEDGGLSYIVMELCPGRPATAYKSADRLLPIQWVLGLIAQAADALQYAHGQNVIHRDIKPANLLYDANGDSVKITDFGIARLTDTVRTRSGILVGTPTYMAPEQFSGGAVDGRTDIFSLGVTAYQLLTGWVPFRAASLPKLLDLVVHQPHEAASKLRPGLPPCIDQILDVALAKDPDSRYPNARAMAAVVRDCGRALGT